MENYLEWQYGGFAVRHNRISPSRWYCTDSDYSWFAITDDFGNLVTVGAYINNREY